MTRTEKLKLFNDYLKQIKEQSENWRIPEDEATLNIYRWAFVNGVINFSTIEELKYIFDNVYCNDEFINYENINEYEEEQLKRITNHTKKYFINLFKDHKKGLILTIPTTDKKGLTILKHTYAIYNLRELEPKTKQKRFIVLGCKWFDRVNGNTYHNAKILDTKTNNIYYVGYSYGYGSAYYYDALAYIKDNFKLNDEKARALTADFGAFYATKQEAKNGNF